jgi:hypothetical protein
MSRPTPRRSTWAYHRNLLPPADPQPARPRNAGHLRRQWRCRRRRREHRLACDIVLAARSASFIQAFCKLGLVPDAGGTWALPRLVGNARAMGLAMLGDKLSAEQAESWGLIWKCLDDDKLMAEAEKLAVHFSTAPTKGLARTKQAIYASGGNTLEQQLDLERDYQRELGFGPTTAKASPPSWKSGPPIHGEMTWH